MSPTPAGVLVVDKAPGLTSQQVVGRVRRLAGTRKVGHAGTLDPMATGVLVVGIGRATRLLGHLMRGRKGYSATIRFGQTTVTDDAEGDPTGAAGAGDLTLERVRSALPDFTGEISQVPTAVSAVKVDGRRAYALVRAGEDVELRARDVTVHSFVATAARAATAATDGAEVAVLDVDIEVECSSGTYIRALARDLGARFGTGGHLTRLRRTFVGPFDLARATVLDPAPEPLPVLGLDAVARECFPAVDLDAAAATDVGFGRRLDLELPAELTALFDPDGRFLALYRRRGRAAVAEAVFV
ncbi:tRNA pseudouridine(55) synthase TruB [Desertihabitans brevis]|uniref:tRNA pseudouridine synthase B n=1 Tax=Desertihabitans brevis TaxID=2268447 RepID=A0A367YQM8_9ACTN|nr:tRNA pseudouridine(55) synthase TruB [Desertihabitans brevis]RCK68128.1 tRNA pseudouridine(55) synthase TruB [Desertihabitans brevis]